MHHLAAFAAAVLASCACMGADEYFSFAAYEGAGSGAQGGESLCATGIVSAVSIDDSDAGHIWFKLHTPSGEAYVAAPASAYPLDKLLALTDAEVEVRAQAMAQSRWKRFSGRFLLADDSIRTLKPAPETAPEFPGDPFDVKEFTRRESSGEFAHRVRIKGLLVTDCKRFLFMETMDGQIVKLIMQTGAKRSESGTMVEATGFVSYDYGGLMMRDVVLSPLPDAPKPPPLECHETTLDKAHRHARYLNGFSRRVVSFTGETTTDFRNVIRGDIVWLKDEGNFAIVDVSSHYDTMKLRRLGTIVRVTGICDPEFETDPTATTFPHFAGITIIPLPENGVEVLDSAWLTFKVLAFISINLVVIIVLVTVALVVQRVLYNRRGRQLFAERVARVRAQTKTEERTRLATELHDAVSQTLTGVALQVDSANLVNRGENAALTKCLGTARQLLASCRRELRDCLWDLRSRTFDEKDMTEAVSRAIAPHSGGVKTAVRFNVPRNVLSESKVHCILSIARELVVNAVKHGKATKIWIAGECSDGRISFSVRDNGCGFDIESAPGPNDGHFGIKGIGERARAAKGTFSIESAPGKGTKATITLPEGE